MYCDLEKGVNVMNKILFQGKLKNENMPYKKGQWVQGDLCQLVDGKRVIPHIYGYGEVIPRTVSRYSGFEATNGKIFEHHIIRCGTYLFVVSYGRCGRGYEGFYLQGYDRTTKKRRSQGLRDDIYYWIENYGAEIVGNVFDVEDIE